MRSFNFVAAASLAILANAAPLDTSDIVERQTTPYQIRGVQDPIYHLYLQALPSDGEFRFGVYTSLKIGQRGMLTSSNSIHPCYGPRGSL